MIKPISIKNPCVVSNYTVGSQKQSNYNSQSNIKFYNYKMGQALKYQKGIVFKQNNFVRNTELKIIEDENNRCGIGDTITVFTSNGDYEITFTDAYFTEYRNEFEELQPENVLVVEYEYTNISYEPLIADGLYIMHGLDYQIYGQDGFSLDTYPYYPLDGDSVSVGRSSVGSDSFHVNNGQTHFEIEIADIIVEIDLE